MRKMKKNIFFCLKQISNEAHASFSSRAFQRYIFKSLVLVEKKIMGILGFFSYRL